MPDTQFSHQELIELVQEVARRLGKEKVSRSEFFRETGVSEWQILKHFESWNNFVKDAGLVPTIVTRISDDVLFHAMYDVFVKYGGLPTRTKFRKLCEYSDYVYTKRWGRWDNVLVNFRDWISEIDNDFPYLAQLPSSKKDLQQDNAKTSNHEPTQAKFWTASQHLQYGQFLNFRGLQHAPINEQGVVFLFGMVAHDLGFVVESVAAGYPDCEAKRRISKERWERISIEFEYRSKNFLLHGHDPSKCNLIVCWLDDWGKDCPVEVLELKTAIHSLDTKSPK